MLVLRRMTPTVAYFLYGVYQIGELYARS